MRKWPITLTVVVAVGVLALCCYFVSIHPRLSGPTAMSVANAELVDHKDNSKDIPAAESNIVSELAETKHTVSLPTPAISDKRTDHVRIPDNNQSRVKSQIPFSKTVLALPKQMPSSTERATDLIKFITVVNEDLKQVDRLLSEEDFTVTEWNMFRQTIVEMPDEPVTWTIYLNGPNGTMSGGRKRVYADNARQEEIRSQGYSISAHKATNVISGVRRNDGNEYVLLFADGGIREYARKLRGYVWYSITWDEDGEILAEETRDYTKSTIARRKRLLEMLEKKNDPHKAEAVRGLREEIEEAERNQSPAD